MYFCCVWFCLFVCLSIKNNKKKEKLEEILTKHYFVVFLPQHKKKNKEKERHGRTTTTTTTMTMSMSMQRISFLSFGRRSAAIGNTRKKIEKFEKNARKTRCAAAKGDEERGDADESVESLALSALQTATRSATFSKTSQKTGKSKNANTNVIKLNKTRALFNSIEDSFENKRSIDEKPPVIVRDGRIYESKYASMAKYVFLVSMAFGILVACLRIYFGLNSTYYFDFQSNRFSTSKVLALCVDAIADSIVYAICIAPAIPTLVLTGIKARLNARLREDSAFLPYSLAPYAAKDSNEQKSRRRAIDVSANVKRHREFARLKARERDCAELRFSFALSVLEANRTLAFVALAFKTLALGFGPSRYASPSLFTLDVCLSACAFCSAIVASALTRDETNLRKKTEKETRGLERAHLSAQHKGTFLCRWESDPYDLPGKNTEGAPSERNLIGVDKAITNSAVGEAAQLSVLELGVSQERCLSLTLDAKDGLTSSELVRRGFNASSVFIPNPYTSVVYALQNGTFSADGVSKKKNAFTGTVEAFLASREPASESFQVVYLDHCGAVVQRTQQIYDVFSRHAVNDNGIFAVTFSTRGKRTGWSKDEAVRFAAETIHDAATKHGYVLEGNAAPSMPGLVDYTLSSGSAFLSSSGVSNLRASDEEAKVLKAMSSSLTKQDDIALALCSLKWANLEQTESEVALETWKSQRRRQMLFDVAETISKNASKTSSTNESSSNAELRKLRSLAREVLEVRTKASALGASFGGGGNTTYPKVLYLYGTLMFFVFKVRCV